MDIALYCNLHAQRPFEKYPMIMQRTPYSCALWSWPIQEKHWPKRNHDEEGYIVVYQDVRGRWMSDGLYDNMRFHS
jgi:predicted acyl esterase